MNQNQRRLNHGLMHGLPAWTLAFMLALALAFNAQAAAAQETEPAPAAAAGELNSAAVTIDGEAVVVVYGITAFPADKRAANVRQNIIDAARDAAVAIDDIVVIEDADNNRSVIRAGDRILMNVLDADARMEGIDRKLLGAVYQDRIAKTIAAYRENRSRDVILQRSTYALVATAVAVLLGWLIIYLFRRLDRWTTRTVQSRLDDLASKSHELIRAQTVWGLVASLIRLTRLAVLLLLAYFFLNTVLGLFPWTRPLAGTLFSLILDPLARIGNGMLQAIPDLAFLAVLFLLVRYLLKLLLTFFRGIESGRIRLQNFDDDWAMPTYKIVRVMVIAFALVVAYPYIPGSDSLAFKGVSVFVGVLLSLGSSSFISNMIAGLAMTYRRAFKEGDRVRIGDVIGRVEEIKLMVTRLRTPKNENVIIPNSNILNSHVVNYSTMAREEGIILHTTVGIGYETPWRQVEAMLLLAAARTADLQEDPPPFVLQLSLGDFAVNYQLNAYSKRVDRMLAIYSELHANILDVFNEHGVQIMTPAYEGDPEQPKLVPPGEWYAAPAKAPPAAP